MTEKSYVNTLGPPLQPLLAHHQLILSAPVQAWSNDFGEMGEAPIHGIYYSDTRIVSSLTLTLNGIAPEALSVDHRGAEENVYVSLDRQIDKATTPDPRLRIERQQRLGKILETSDERGFSEEVKIINAAHEALKTGVEIEIICDFANMISVKDGRSKPADQILYQQEAGKIVCEDGDLQVIFETDASETQVKLVDSRLVICLKWQVSLAALGAQKLSWRFLVKDEKALYLPSQGSPPWQEVKISTGDSRLSRWLQKSLEDLNALRMNIAVGKDQVEEFIGAGTPWYFTLYGRDCLWTAQMLLPLGTELAGSTLRALAALQGKQVNPANAEQPGKILHEVRKIGAFQVGQFDLPPVYYGTIDATLLWIIVLRDAWKWGLSDEEIRALLPNLEAALIWLKEYADADGDGFIEYVDESGHGLSNQGWKDSGDSISFHDGRLAEAPIALCEVQGYAYAAALAGAELLEAFGRPGAEDWRLWASKLKQNFIDKFWIETADGGYLAVALDKDKNQVDSLTSNMGHLLTTGILDESHAARVAELLVSPALNSGFGLRTLATTEARYWPITYHNGSVWPHDTVIAITGLVKSSFPDQAAQLIEGMLKAAEAFDYRIPELYSGDGADIWHHPVNYSAACLPLCWSAGASVAALGAILGLEPDNSGLKVKAMPHFGTIQLSGIRHANQTYTVSVDSQGNSTFQRTE